MKTLYVVQGFYGVNGWEDLTASDDEKEAKQDLKGYDENEPQYPHRIDVRTVLRVKKWVTAHLKES